VPNLRDFERRLGGLVEGFFAKAFRSGLQPIELAKRLIKEMDAGRTVGVSEVWAPNRFVFAVSQPDGDRLLPAEAAIATELRRVIRENAEERGWGLVGPPEVAFRVDEDLRKGDLDCTASLAEGAEQIRPSTPAHGVDPFAAPGDAAADGTGGAEPQRGTIVVHENGGVRQVPLTGEVLTIGRLSDCDIVLRDKGVSRRHAQVRDEGGRLTITDLGSTNGTRLNGQSVGSRELSDGDRVTIGTTILEFRRT
jgi:hypothetical protein